MYWKDKGLSIYKYLAFLCIKSLTASYNLTFLWLSVGSLECQKCGESSVLRNQTHLEPQSLGNNEVKKHLKKESVMLLAHHYQCYLVSDLSSYTLIALKIS